MNIRAIEMLPFIDIGGTWHKIIFFMVSLTALKWVIADKHFPFMVKIFGLYVFLRALFILEYPAIHFGPFTPSFQQTAAQVIAEMIFIPLGVILFLDFIPTLLPIVTIFTLACIWLKKPGLLNAISFNSAFAATMMPLLKNKWLKACIVATALVHHGSTALAIIGAQLLIYAVKNKTFWLRYLVLALPVLLISAFFHTGKFFDSGERLLAYKDFFNFWAKETRWIALGVGPGSFIWTSVMKHKFETGFETGYFLQMHSDWLQILWELGCVGLLLAMATFISAVKNVWQVEEGTSILSALFGVAVFGITYHPLRFYPTAFLTAYIFVKAFNYKTDLLVAPLSNLFGPLNKDWLKKLRIT